MAPAEAGISKADISFRIGCEYLESFTLYGQTFKKDATKDFASPFYCTGNLNVVVRKDIKSGEYEVKKNMNEFFHANVLYLMRYTGHYQMTREKLKQFRKDLYKEKIYLVFYDEINRAKDVLDDFGVLL
jgi:hypothetical protein